jgi:hypothetical protein
MKDIFVRPFLTGAACALALLFGVAAAHASRLGVVSFANGASTPQKLPAVLVTAAATRNHLTSPETHIPDLIDPQNRHAARRFAPRVAS